MEDEMEKKFDKEELKNRLDEESFRVTQEGATEAPYSGKYYKNKKDGMYHCVVCDEPLFESTKKFDSHSGWPSFFDPATDDSVGLRSDNSAGMARTEAVCKKCGAHLGHLFNDAPETPTGQRFCINSASLKFKDESGEDTEDE